MHPFCPSRFTKTRWPRPYHQRHTKEAENDSENRCLESPGTPASGLRLCLQKSPMAMKTEQGPPPIKCRCPSGNHGHKPGKFVEFAVTPDHYCQRCHDKNLEEAARAKPTSL